MPEKIRSEEHTSELQSRFGISYAVFCLKKKKIQPLAPPLHGAPIGRTPVETTGAPRSPAVPRYQSSATETVTASKACAVIFFLMKPSPPEFPPLPPRRSSQN